MTISYNVSIYPSVCQHALVHQMKIIIRGIFNSSKHHPLIHTHSSSPFNFFPKMLTVHQVCEGGCKLTILNWTSLCANIAP